MFRAHLLFIVENYLTLNTSLKALFYKYSHSQSLLRVRASTHEVLEDTIEPITGPVHHSGDTKCLHSKLCKGAC